MARATTVAWMGIFVGLALQAGAAEVPMPGQPAPPLPMTPVSALPVESHSAFHGGVDAYRRADYEAAQRFFAQAQASLADLSSTERQELATLVRLNDTALKSRRDGAAQLHRAQQAATAGRLTEADQMLRALGTNQFLAAEDQFQARKLAERLQSGISPASATATPPGAVSPDVLARTKLQQARQLMAKANYDTAEALAQEVRQMNIAFRPGEDTPQRVINDIARIRGDTKRLLSSARIALQCGDLDRAENLAKAAAKGGWSVSQIWGDTPAKVLKDVQAARAQAPMKPATPQARVAADTHTVATAQKPSESPASKNGISNNEAAHYFLKEGRKALQRQDLVHAKECAERALALEGSFYWWDDSPTKLLADVQRASKEHQTTAQLPKPAPVPGSNLPDASAGDPHSQLKSARDLYAANRLEDAEKLAQKVQASGFKDWKLFDDTPEKLLADIKTAKTKQAQVESVRVLREARILMERGDYAKARAEAYRAERLHGAYSVLDLGDRPSKLIADIDAAEARAGKAKLSMAATEVARKDNGPVAPITTATSHTKSSDAGTAAVQRTQFTSDAPPLPELPTANKSDAPAPPMPQAAPKAPDMAKQKALSLLANARRHQRDGHLVEARHCALESLKTGTTWTDAEDRPDRCLQELTDLAHRRIEFLQQEATDLGATAFADPSRYQKAETDLLQARNLAQAYALDSQSIDAKVNWLQQARRQPATGQATPTVTQVAAAQHEEKATAPTPQQQGLQLLDKARLELKRGDLETARRLAVEVYSGKYGLQEQANAVLHSIDAEEFNQRILTANHAFDAGLRAYAQKDYAHAASIFHALEMPLLSPEKQAKLKDLLLTPELRGSASAAQTARTDPPVSAPPGRATVTDLPTPTSTANSASKDVSYAEQVRALQEVQFQELRTKGLTAQREATEHVRNGDTARALEILQDYLSSLKGTQLDPQKAVLLQRPVEARLQDFKKVKEHQDFEKEQAGRKNAFSQERKNAADMEEHKQKQVSELMKEYHKLFDQAKWAEAELTASKALELDPGNAQVAAAKAVAHMNLAHAEYDAGKREREEYARKILNGAERVGPAATTSEPVQYDPKRWDIARNRKPIPGNGWEVKIKTDAEREIERRLSQPISLDFKDEKLKDVLVDLRQLTGINIVPDMPALNAEGVSLEQPVDIHLEAISVKNALSVILHNAKLIYVIANDVISVTTEAYARGKTVTRTYAVGDLIIPVEDHVVPDSADFNKVMNKLLETPRIQGTGATPFLNQNALQAGAPVGSATGPNGTVPSGTSTTVPQNPSRTLEDKLIALIKNEIVPASWSDMGGPGTIDYFPLGQALVINQTPDIQEQVAELLSALRRLQDMEVTVEVRFITIDESFYERIGVDFNINVLTNNTKAEQLVVGSPQSFAPPGFNNVFRPKSFITGLVPGGSNTPPGAFTQDLAIPIINSSFGPGVPPFGGFPNAPGADGGLSLGLAFLSDIQVFLFLEAAQGDQRTNVMQAPKLTLFNGQSSTIMVSEQQFFVTSLSVLQSNGQIVYLPNNTPVPLNVQLAIQAVVSADRRFVRLNLNPILTNIGTATAALFPVTTFITPVFENGAQGQPVPFTQYLQQPTFSRVDVSTTVMVPDGGTVLLGGLKTMREGRNEFGPPILSKLPYISRLFKNVGYGRETESLMIMVTPRIIINEEEETRQTGEGTGLGLPSAGPAGVGGAGAGGAPGS